MKRKHADTTLPHPQGHSLDRRIECGLAETIGLVTGRIDVRDASHMTADRHDQPSLAAHQVVDQCLADAYSTEDVHGKGILPVITGDAAQQVPTPTLPVDTRVVDQHIQRGCAELPSLAPCRPGYAALWAGCSMENRAPLADDRKNRASETASAAFPLSLDDPRNTVRYADDNLIIDGLEFTGLMPAARH